MSRASKAILNGSCVNALLTRRLCSGLALAFFLSSLAAQNTLRPINQFSQENWQTSNGLPQSSVHAIVQTQDGYLWLGTQEGLVRFDGVRFTVFDRLNTPQIRANHIQTLYTAKDGALWIGMYGGGLARFKEGQFRHYGRSEGLFSNSIAAVTEDRDGVPWIATQDAGISRLTAQGFTNYTTTQGLASAATSSIAVDKQGTIWIGTAAGACRFENGRFSTFTQRNGLLGDSITALAADPDGSVWIGSGQGLNRWYNGKVESFTVKNGLPHDFVRTLHVDSAGSLWVGTRGGLCRLKDGVFSSLTTRDGLTNNNVIAVFQDSEGSYWVGTDGGGLSRWRNASFVTYGPQQGLFSEQVYSITGSNKGGFWAGTYNGEIYRFQNGRFERLATKGQLAGIIIRALREDNQGNLWIGTELQLYCYKNGVFIPYDQSKGLPGFPVRVIFEDSENRIWVGTDGGGLSRLEGDRLLTYTMRDGLASNRIRTIVQDKDGALWIGCYGGLSRIKDGRFTVYTTAQGLSHDFIRSLYLDQDGTLWIGTYGGGLNRFRDGKFNFYGTRDGLFSATAFQILDDDRGSLWLSCNTGVFRVSKHQLEAFAVGISPSITSVAFSEADGMKSRECNGGSPAGWKTEDGKLWFPTLKGIAMVEPGNIQRNSQPPPVIVEEALVDGRPFVPRELLPPGSRRFEFRYTGLSFVSPSRMRFAYRLEGFDQQWIDAGNQRTAYYTSIPAGDYRFLVRAANNDGVWSKTEASFDFTLQPFFYQSAYFYALCGLLIAAAGVGFYLLRTRQLRQRQRVLEAKVDEAVAHIKTLRGLLPICASCKRIRDDSGYWNQIEQYVHEHTEAQFSHGICPDCMKKLYPDYAAALHAKKEKSGVIT